MQNQKGIISLCSRENIGKLLYVTVFLLPLTTWFYIPLVIAFLMSIYRMYAVRQVEWKAGSLCEVGAAFLICSFCSVINSLDKIFSIFNWFFLPCMYAILYMLIVSYLDTIKKKKKLLLCFLGAAAAVAGYGIWQYIHIDYMIAHVINQEWVDTKEFPHLYRRMYSTLENPNLCATYFLIVISYVGAFFLFEKEIKNKVILMGIGSVATLCLALTYSRGAWVSLLFILFIYASIYDKKIFTLFTLVPFILYFYEGQVVLRFLSLFSTHDTSVGMRFTLWANTLDIIKDFPLLGCGWGTFYLTYPMYDSLVKDAGILIYHAHNMYLSMIATIGFLGAFSYFFILFGHAWYAWRMYLTVTNSFYKAMGLGTLAAVAAISVNGIGDYTLFSVSISMCYWSMMALFMSCYVDISHSIEPKEQDSMRQ